MNMGSNYNVHCILLANNQVLALHLFEYHRMYLCISNEVVKHRSSNCHFNGGIILKTFFLKPLLKWSINKSFIIMSTLGFSMFYCQKLIEKSSI